MTINDMPIEVKENIHVHTYTMLNELEHVVFQAKRTPTEKDIPLIVDGKIIKQRGTYYGDWVDTTEKAKTEEKVHCRSKFKAPDEVADTIRTEREKELMRAQELLNKLINGGEE